MYSLTAAGEIMMSSGLTEKIKKIHKSEESFNPLLPESLNGMEHKCSIEINGNRLIVVITTVGEDCVSTSRSLLKITSEILLNAYSMDPEICSSISQIKEIKLVSCKELDQNREIN